MCYYTAIARRIDSLMLGLTDDQIGEIMQVIGVGADPSIRRMAEVVGKSPGTIHRWKTTNPELYRAISEYVARYQSPPKIDREKWIDAAIHAHVNAPYPASEFEAIYDALKSGELPQP